MLNEAQKEKVINHICGLIKESIYENGYFENFFGEKAKKDSEKSKEKDSDEDSESEKSGRRESVMKWLDTAQELHSVLSYKLFPDITKDAARSLFSKKYRGHDDDGNEYSFDIHEINKLYNMKDAFIKRIS